MSESWFYAYPSLFESPSEASCEYDLCYYSRSLMTVGREEMGSRAGLPLPVFFSVSVPSSPRELGSTQGCVLSLWSSVDIIVLTWGATPLLPDAAVSVWSKYLSSLTLDPER